MVCNALPVLWCLSLLLLLSGTSVSGAEQASAAQNRATLYQSEIRAVLLRHHWRILWERPGRLLADHAFYATAAYGIQGSNGFMRADISLQAESATGTLCTAKVFQHLGLMQNKGELVPGDKEVLRMVGELIDEARERLRKGHPDMFTPKT